MAHHPARIAAELTRPTWGEVSLSANGVWRVLRRHGLSTRAKRHGLVAGYAAPPEPQRPQPPPQRHLHLDHPGELVQLDCFRIGRLSGTKGDGVAIHRHRPRQRLHLGHPTRPTIIAAAAPPCAGVGIRPRIARRMIESSERLGRHRWRIKRTGAWLGGWRRLRIRHQRSSERFSALAMLACSVICCNALQPPPW